MYKLLLLEHPPTESTKIGEEAEKMSNDAKRSIQGNQMVKSVSEDRKPMAVATTGKKIVIKSADMFGDVQKEAVDVAIVVSFLFSIAIVQISSTNFIFELLFFLMILSLFRILVQAFEKHSVEKDVAEYIKKEFDKRHGPTWHCIVGRNFGN